MKRGPETTPPDFLLDRHTCMRARDATNVRPDLADHPIEIG
jgi:hypothetical protein